MRLQLIAALVLGASPAAADPGADATIRVYTDDDDITVVSPSVRAETAIGATTVEVDATADAVTGASVDVVTAASPLPIDERRVELGLGAERAGVSVLLRGSHENDYDALRAGAGVRLDLLTGQVSLELRYLGGYDAIGTVVDPGFHRDRTLHQADAGISVVLDPRTVVDVLVEATTSSGYHASPYRRVPLVDPAWPTPMWLAEQVPGARRSIAGAGRMRRAIGDDWFTTIGYRAYVDDWAISSHTLAVDARRQIHPRVLGGLAVRGYLQDGASFYRSSYVDDGEVPALRTRDRTLGPMRTLFASITTDVTLDDDERWHALLASGVLASWFPDFPLQADRHALVVTVSLSMAFGGDE